jgi:hypothetical protein
MRDDSRSNLTVSAESAFAVELADRALLADQSSLIGRLMPEEPRRRMVIELAVGYLLILAAIWTPRPWQGMFSLIVLAWVVAITCISFDGWRPMGLRLAGLLRSLWVVILALELSGLAVLLARRLHTLDSPVGAALLVKNFWGYGVWSFMQQFLLQDFFLLRLLHLLPSKKAAILAAAALFALAHLPNPLLTAVTLLWGAIACMIFLRYRNIYALGMTHAILGISLAVTVPGPVDHNMRVGLGYLRYQPGQHRHALTVSRPIPS